MTDSAAPRAPVQTLPAGVSPIPDTLQTQLTAADLARRERRPEALALLEAALAAAQAQGSRLGVMFVKHWLGHLMFNLRRDADSARYHAEVLEEGRALDHGPTMASSLYALAHVDVVQGRLDQARERYGQSLALYEAAGLPEAQSIPKVLHYLDGLEAAGRLDEAFAGLRWAPGAAAG